MESSGCELVEIDRLDDIAVGEVIVGDQPIFIFIRGSKNDDREMLGAFFCADRLENIQAAELGEIHIEENDCRRVRHIPGDVFDPSEQVIKSLDPVTHTNDWVGNLGTMKRQHCQFSIVVIVFDQENHLLPHCHCGLPKVKEKVAPWPTAAATQMRPPCREMMRRTVANPIPVPSNSASR